MIALAFLFGAIVVCVGFCVAWAYQRDKNGGLVSSSHRPGPGDTYAWCHEEHDTAMNDSMIPFGTYIWDCEEYTHTISRKSHRGWRN